MRKSWVFALKGFEIFINGCIFPAKWLHGSNSFVFYGSLKAAEATAVYT